jgi:imidazole glycerol phosphate synthase glutamine amidotransferase subunit
MSDAAADVVVVQTGTANLASVLVALARAGAEARLAESPAEIDRAAHVVLPGVGAFGAAMTRLRSAGLVEPLARRITAGRPTLCICLGMQLLCESSDETPGVPGIGVVGGHVQCYSGRVRVPQLGWNRVDAEPACGFLRSGYAYFANSYRLADPPQGWSIARSEHGESFIAAIERGGVLACQFHPELSGAWGRALFERWLEAAGLSLRPGSESTAAAGDCSC